MKGIITFLTLVFVALFAGAQSSQPNIGFILVDDMGWGDLGKNLQNEKTGKKHFIPELDALIQGGVRMEAHCLSPATSGIRARIS